MIAVMKLQMGVCPLCPERVRRSIALSRGPSEAVQHYDYHILQYHRQLGGRNWFKSRMNHSQTGNMLENLSQ